MDVEEHFRVIEDQVSNGSYAILDEDPINEIRKSINRIVGNWSAPCPNIRVKMHKNPIKYRVIIDSAGSALSSIKRWVKNELS